MFSNINILLKYYKYYICFGNDTIPIDLNIKYYVCLKHKLFK